MGNVLFLNEKSKKFHEEQGIKISQPPELRVVINNGPSKKKKPKKKTLGKRIFENYNSDGDDAS